MGQILKISVLVRRLKLSQQQIDELLKADMIKNVKVFHSTYLLSRFLLKYINISGIILSLFSCELSLWWNKKNEKVTDKFLNELCPK